MNIIGLKYIFLFSIILTGSYSFSYIFKKRLCQTIPLTFFSIMFLLYIFGLFHNLKLGILSIILLFFITFISCIIHSIVHKNFIQSLKNYILSYDLIIFTFIFLLFSYTTYSRILTACDDYGYWSMAVKNMFYLDDFITNPNSIIRLIYPPFPTTLQYFFEKIIGENKQGIELFTNILLGFSLFLPFLKNCKTKRKFALVCIIGMFFSIPAIFIESWFYFTIYVDSLLGLLVGYILYEYFTSTRDLFFKFEMILAFFTLTLMKPTGIVIALVLSLVFIFDVLIKIYKANKLKNIFKKFFHNEDFKIIVLISLTIIITFCSWALYKKINVNNSNENIIKDSIFNTIYNTIFGIFSNNPEYAEDASSLLNLPSDLFDKTTYTQKPIGLSAGSWLSIFIVSSILIEIFIFKNNKKFLIYMTSILIGTIIYICLLQAAYIFVFPDYEAASHVSLERYLGTFFIAILFVITGIVVDYFNKKEYYNKCIYPLILAVILIFTPISPIMNATLAAKGVNSGIASFSSSMIEGSGIVPEKLQANSNLYVLHQKSNINDNFVKFQYFSYPIRTTNYNRLEEESDINTFQKLLFESYDYIFIIESDEYFNNNFNRLFLNNTITDWTLYQINKDFQNQTITLSPIYE